MARGKKTGGKDFKPGQSGNPAGRPPLPPEVRQARKNLGDFLKSGVGEIMMRFYSMPREDFERWAKESLKQSSMLENHLAAVLSRALREGDMAVIERLLDRYIGRPRQAFDLSGQVNTSTQLTQEQLSAMAKEFVKRER